MKVSYNWLKSYLDFDYTPAELAEVMTMAGLEVDDMEYLGEGIDDIIVGVIDQIDEHPNADKLVICHVNIGEEKLQIVTGAPNVFEGARVPVATVGVILPNGLEIKTAKLRGVPSYGMLCSTDELGFSTERAKGIMILEDNAVPGIKLIDYLGINDYVLKLDLTPNYARCLGMLGIVRELNALDKQGEISYPEIDIKEYDDQQVTDYIKVEIADSELCPRYTGRVIRNVKIGPSPDWMQKRLKAAGIRPINNVVDITNYVLMEYNQPLHAFDYDKIKGQKIIVRRANKDEKMLTLDDQERILDVDVLVIADMEDSIGLAGVMGGANSEVSDDTVNVFLESAYFNPVNIRKTARKLALPSEASHRFERGVDIENLITAANRAAYLMQELAGGKVVSGIIDEYPIPFEAPSIELKREQVNTILGIELTLEEISDMLSRLGFEISKATENLINVTVPSYRGDVEREADLIEEIARVFGYNKIPVTRPGSSKQGGKTFKQKLEDMTKTLMEASGLDEVITFSLTAEEKYEELNIPTDSNLRNWVRIKNPLNESFAILRTSMVPGILEVLGNNARRQVSKMAVYELGNIFSRTEASFNQQLMLAGGSMGYPEDSWNSSAADFFYLKGILESYLSTLGVAGLRFKASSRPYLHPGRTAEVYSDQIKLGIIGEVHPDLINDLDLYERTTVFQLNIDAVLKQVQMDKAYQNLPKYPAVERDLAILINKDINAGDILLTIEEKAGKLLKTVDIFDLYQGDQIPEDQKSVAYKLIFQAEDKTLTDSEINKIFNRVVKHLENVYDAKIRGN